MLKSPSLWEIYKLGGCSIPKTVESENLLPFFNSAWENASNGISLLRAVAHGLALLCFRNWLSFGRLVQRNHRLLILVVSEPCWIGPVRHGSGIWMRCLCWAESLPPKHHHLIWRRMPDFPRLVNQPPLWRSLKRTHPSNMFMDSWLSWPRV